MLPRCYCRPSDARAHCPSKPISTSACRGQRLTAGGSKNNRRASPWTHNFFVEAPQQPPAPSKKEKYGPLLRCGLIKKRPIASLRHMVSQRGLFINTHIKWSTALYLLCWSRRSLKCSDKKGCVSRGLPRSCQRMGRQEDRHAQSPWTERGSELTS